MDTVWVVESGEYSDYQIDAIFSTKEKAEEFSSHKSRSRVVEWELDKWTPEQASFSVVFDLSGNITGIDETPVLDEPSDAVDADGFHDGSIHVRVHRGPREKAIKIASEYYYRLRAFLDEAQERTSKAHLPQECLDGSRTIRVAKVLAGINPVPNPPKCGFDEDVLEILGIKPEGAAA